MGCSASAHEGSTSTLASEKQHKQQESLSQNSQQKTDDSRTVNNSKQNGQLTQNGNESPRIIKQKGLSSQTSHRNTHSPKPVLKPIETGMVFFIFM